MSPLHINNNFHIARHNTNPNSNYVSTADTILLMREMAYGARDSEVIILALREILESESIGSNYERVIPKTTISRDKYTQFLIQTFNWVKSNVVFKEDEETILGLGESIHPQGSELLLRPDYLLQMPTPTGDCDDFSTLVASILLTSRSFSEIYFVTIAADANRPNDYTHVYLAVRHPETGRLIAIDASHGNMLGWEYPQAFKKEYWRI